MVEMEAIVCLQGNYSGWRGKWGHFLGKIRNVRESWRRMGRVLMSDGG